MLLAQPLEGWLKLLLTRRPQNSDLRAHIPCSVLKLADPDLGVGKLRIHKKSDNGSCRYHLAQQLQSLGSQVDRVEECARGIASRPIETDNKALLHRIDTRCEHDWNRRRGCASGDYATPARDNYGNLLSDQIGGHSGHSIRLTVCPAVFDPDVLAFDEAHLG